MSSRKSNMINMSRTRKLLPLLRSLRKRERQGSNEASEEGTNEGEDGVVIQSAVGDHVDEGEEEGEGTESSQSEWVIERVVVSCVRKAKTRRRQPKTRSRNGDDDIPERSDAASDVGHSSGHPDPSHVARSSACTPSKRSRGCEDPQADLRQSPRKRRAAPQGPSSKPRDSSPEQSDKSPAEELQVLKTPRKRAHPLVVDAKVVCRVS